MKNILGICILCFLAGCEHSQLITEPVIVKVPIPVSCNISAISEPDWNIPRLPDNAQAVERLKSALMDLELSKGYIEMLQAGLEACS